jgi:kynurenine formamidase
VNSLRSIFDNLLSGPIDISIPLKFQGGQPNAFGVEAATSKACEYDDLIGDTRRGGSCNFEQVTLIPHCNGTHTECVGHITNERISVRECLTDVFISGMLISVESESAVGCGENYAVPSGQDDVRITRRSLETAISADRCEALVIRTLPNYESKLSRVYKKTFPPYFTTEAMEFIVSLGIKHLLVDLPSIDRMSDEGKLSNHRIFWNVEQGIFVTNAATRKDCTVTELIYVPDNVEDGDYLLNLQIAPFESDASPSRPLLLKIKNS